MNILLDRGFHVAVFFCSESYKVKALCNTEGLIRSNVAENYFGKADVQRLWNEEKTLNQIIIRKETKEDYKKTEIMTRRAFWNMHGPGCNEHFLVHMLRESEDYLPEFSRVAELDGEIVGVIMYSRATVVDGEKVHDVVTFGPLCTEPTLQNSGVGALLLAETLPLLKEAGYPGVVIFGEPDYYPKRGFVTCDHFGITDPEGKNYTSLLAYKLNDAFDQIHGKFYESDVFEVACEDQKGLEQYEKNFPYYKPLKLSCQWLHTEKLGRISSIQKNTFTIRFFEREYPAKLKGSFYQDPNAVFPIVGDYVTFLLNPQGDSTILSVCERSTVLKRPDQSGHAIGYVKTMMEQEMVANFDYVFIVTALNGDYNFNRIARYVSITLQSGAIPVVVLTKSDLCSNPGRYVRDVEALSEKVRVHAICALYDIGLDELKEYFEPGNTIVLVGSSGAGKSTLVNTIAGEELMKTSAIREDDSKGRHTTTYRQLFVLNNGVTIIDTPGMREIGVMGVEEGIEDTFSDIEALKCQCKFSDCEHRTEPGCAIRAALENGSLDPERYQLYLNLQKESSNNAAKMKQIAKWKKQMKKR